MTDDVAVGAVVLRRASQMERNTQKTPIVFFAERAHDPLKDENSEKRLLLQGRLWKTE